MAGRATIAAHPRTVLELSGPPMSLHGDTAEAMRPYVRAAIDALGPDRGMFGSNFSVDSLHVGYRPLWEAFSEGTADLTAAERRPMFSLTAARTYAPAVDGGPPGGGPSGSGPSPGGPGGGAPPGDGPDPGGPGGGGRDRGGLYSDVMPPRRGGGAGPAEDGGPTPAPRPASDAAIPPDPGPGGRRASDGS